MNRFLKYFFVAWAINLVLFFILTAYLGGDAINGKMHPYPPEGVQLMRKIFSWVMDDYDAADRRVHTPWAAGAPCRDVHGHS